ncbi:MAG: CoA transferase [Sphingomonadaceae bacterium]|uniref:CaiB/BaiF CoA transferase family protein n=1 Tax=Thermaurantiacus sp. TaxID=2820283 RepID=UPI00298F354A|nr:CoA transferase [Thermaurantiacus sp.]MCS6987123.1 CoA transferase [Sphingomonadaceae bacterium]MDW8415843.1 CoA transferase [Thermaurantiacus sp.]
MGALEGLRVIETGSLVAGPFCGQLLADHGAEVIKIEPPARRHGPPGGDPMRRWGQGKPLWFSVLARNKKTVTLELSHPRGRELLCRLLRRSDVLIENFRPGTFERWGLGWERLRAENPALVFVRISGFGQTGPYAGRPSSGAIGEAMGGLRALMGWPDRPPVGAGVALGDALVGLFAGLGTLMALHHRQRTGEGQVVDAAVFEAVLALLGSAVPEYTEAGIVRQRGGAAWPGVAPANLYPCADGEVLIEAEQDAEFARLAQAMGAPELARDPRFESHAARAAHRSELDLRIAAWTRPRPMAEVLARLEAADVPAGRLYRVPDMLADPHFAARDALVAVAHPEFPNLWMQAPVPKLSETPGDVRWAGPPLGAFNAEVFRGLLGLSGTELAELERDGVI